MCEQFDMGSLENIQPLLGEAIEQLDAVGTLPVIEY